MMHYVLQKVPASATQNPRFLRLKQIVITALFLFLGLAWSTVQAQSRQVSGKVTEAGGGALPGVTVQVKGTTNGTASDAEGNFTLAVPDNNAVLVVSFIGYVAKEVPVGNQTTINVVLSPDAKALEEVVVIGYGTQRAEAVTGSVASIRGEAIREVPAANISQALQGRLPGVEMTQSSSRPGAAMQIRIRGTRSLSASNDPLVVLDGIPFAGSISDINPNDIKSIDILKDASATAIYGSRGANGVILVTTNKGQAGQKATVTYNSFAGPKTLFSRYPMMNGPEFVAFRKAAGLYTNSLDESDDVNTDWQDLLYQTGMTQSHDLGVSGGTEQGSYNFSMGYFDDKGVIPTQQYTRYSVRGSLDQGIGKYLRLGFVTNNNFNTTQGNNVGLYGVLSASPIANPYNPDGSLKRSVRIGATDEHWIYTKETVEELRDRWLDETKAFATYNTLYGEVKIPGVEGLKYRANLGLNYRQSNSGSFTGQGIGNASNPLAESIANTRTALTLDWTIENILSYDRTFGGKHDINAVALYSAAQNRFTQHGAQARNIPNESFQYYNLSSALGEISLPVNDQRYEQSGLMSWMGRVMYSYNNRYMLSATLRSDGSSRLAPGHKWHTYPAVSAGWNIGNEGFMQGLNFVDNLKLRAGFGQTSNQAVGVYSTLGRLTPRPYNFGDTYSTGFYVSNLPNPNLGWEFSKTWNYGLDFGVLNNRLSGTIEYYVTKTEDILLGLSLPRTAGVTSGYTTNIGATQNKGFELSLNGVILENANGFRWEAGANFYTNQNRLVSLASGETRNEGNWWFVGHPLNVIFDYEKVGLWQEGDPHMNILQPGPANQVLGSIKVKYTGDYNPDGTPVRAIGPADRQIMNADPDFQGGFNTRLSYKGFDLSTVGAFKSGGILISTLYSSAGYLNLNSGRRNNVKVDYWTPENTDAKYPRPGSLMSGDNPNYGSTLGYFNASYLKIRTLSLGYNFENSNWVNNIGIDRLRVYVTAQNPFVLFSPYHKESGMDPETNSYADQNIATNNVGPARLLTIGTNSPSTRTYLLGVNLTF